MARTKKISKKAVDEAVQLENERLNAIAAFNRENMGKFWIDATKTPTDEDVAQAKADFEDATKALQGKKDYVIADKENALRVATFLKNFVDNCFWTGRSFVGVLNFSALMKDFIDGFEKNGSPELVLEYGPMQFVYLIMENYGGIGINSANKMAEMWDEYLPIYEKLHELIDWYNLEVHRCDNLKNRWAMFEQGYYMYILEDTEVDPTISESENETVSDEQTDDK